MPAAFLAGRVAEKERRGGRRRLMAWCAWAAVLMTAVGLACVGAYGWQTVERQEVPLYEAAKQVGVSGAFQRLESAVAALLILSDVALPGLMLFSLKAMGSALCPAFPARRLAPVGAAAARCPPAHRDSKTADRHRAAICTNFRFMGFSISPLRGLV